MRLRTSLTRTALAVMAVLVVLATAAAGTAAAAAKKPTTEDHSTCRLDVPGGAIYYPAGTEITVDMGDGTKEVYVCRNGNWEKKTSKAGFVVRRAISSFDYQSVSSVQSAAGATSNVKQTQQQVYTGLAQNVRG